MDTQDNVQGQNQIVVNQRTQLLGKYIYEKTFWLTLKSVRYFSAVTFPYVLLLFDSLS